MEKCGEKVQVSRYRINKYWKCNVQLDAYS